MAGMEQRHRGRLMSGAGKPGHRKTWVTHRKANKKRNTERKYYESLEQTEH